MCHALHSFRRCFGLFLCLLAVGFALLPKAALATDDLTVVTEADLAKGGKIGGTNWMSGISGERRLHEITIPATHDSGMANVEVGSSILDFAVNRAKWTACTQDLGIDDQLTAGVRMFDLRLTDINPLWEFKERKGLWLCHGPRAAARFLTSTFYSKLPESKRDKKYGDEQFLTLDQTMDYYFSFLKAHPTETVIVSLTNENGAGDKANIVKMLKEKLRTWRAEINPSTGKPYIYQQNKSTNDWTITKMPKLADARGQVVLTTDITGDNALGYGMALGTYDGWTDANAVADVRLCFENHYEVGGSNKLEYVEAFYLGSSDPQYQGEDGNDWDEFLSQNPLTDKYSKFLPNPIDHCNYVFTTSNGVKNFFSEDGLQSPRAIAEAVQPALFTDKDALMKTRGVFYGWVNCDFITEDIARTIWLNNYPQGGLAYTTITFAPGKGVGTQKTHTVQTGGRLTFPKNMFELPDSLKKQGYEFVGWEVAENGNKLYQPGETLDTHGFGTLTATAKFEQTWNGVRDVLYSTHQDGATINLENDLVAKKGDVSLVVPTWAEKVTLNLNGHTINRNSTDLNLPCSNPNRVIEVAGELSIIGPGKITGGYAPSGGGITIERYGKLSLKDVVFEKNRADDKQSNDIHVNNWDPDPNLGPALKVAGKTQINEGVLLKNGFVITGVSNLTEGASIRVYTQQAPTSVSPVIISDALTHGASDLQYLQSGQKYGVELGKDGQAKDKAILTAAYKVTYNLMGGRYPNGDGTFSDTIPAELVQYGGTAPDKTGASKLGAAFAGWFKVGESSAYDFTTPVTGDLELEARWTTEQRTLKFYQTENGAYLDDYDQSVIYGQTPTKPADPTREGYDFCGWATRTSFDRSSIIRFDFGKPLLNSYKLFGVWSPKSYQVTFESNGGNDVAAQTVRHGECVVRPANPTYGGGDRVFAGWYVRDMLYDFSTPVEGTITLTAHWEMQPESYTVTFDGNGDGVQNVPGQQNITPGNKATRPADPTRTGHRFAGWFVGDDPYDFETPVTATLTLTAHWIPLLTVSFDTNGALLSPQPRRWP